MKWGQNLGHEESLPHPIDQCKFTLQEKTVPLKL